MRENTMRIATSVLIASVACAALAAQHSWRGAKLEVSLRNQTQRPAYTLKDSMVLDIRISNSGDEPVGVFAKLGMGYQGGLILHVLDHTGAEVATPTLEHDFLDVRAIANRENYFILQPHQFFGTTQRFVISELIGKPGHYSVLVEYHCPINSKDAKISNFWGIERGSIVSSEIPLDVN